MAGRGRGDGTMKVVVLATLLMVLLLVVVVAVEAGDDQIQGQGQGQGGHKKGWLDRASTHYLVLDGKRGTGQERFFCLARGRCHYNTLQCPPQCPQRKPKANKRSKGCFADCSSRCETTCKFRLPNCNGYGSVCYDPRFVGGDGVMFYFHGAKGGDFALVSDHNLQINVHFIGHRPPGRSRDFTWVQSVAVIFDTHTLVLAATTVTRWDDNTDALQVTWDGQPLSIPIDGEAEWRTRRGDDDDDDSDSDDSSWEVVVERTAPTNSVRVTVSGLLEMDMRVTPIGEEENRSHGYGLPDGDAYAHLETQFRFTNLSDDVEGILGQTYRPGYVSRAKQGVAMPVMGGEDKYRLPTLLSSNCKKCRFITTTTTTSTGNADSRDTPPHPIEIE